MKWMRSNSFRQALWILPIGIAAMCIDKFAPVRDKDSRLAFLQDTRIHTVPDTLELNLTVIPDPEASKKPLYQDLHTMGLQIAFRNMGAKDWLPAEEIARAISADEIAAFASSSRRIDLHYQQEINLKLILQRDPAENKLRLSQPQSATTHEILFASGDTTIEVLVSGSLLNPGRNVQQQKRRLQIEGTVFRVDLR